MGNIIDLNRYRIKRQKEWLKQHEERLEIYLNARLHADNRWDFAQIAHSYQSTLQNNSEESWDYLDLREHLETELEDLATRLHRDLTREYWFDRTAISIQKLTEVCLNLFIMGSAGISA